MVIFTKFYDNVFCATLELAPSGRFVLEDVTKILQVNYPLIAYPNIQAHTLAGIGFLQKLKLIKYAPVDDFSIQMPIMRAAWGYRMTRFGNIFSKFPRFLRYAVFICCSLNKKIYFLFSILSGVGFLKGVYHGFQDLQGGYQFVKYTILGLFAALFAVCTLKK